MYFEPYSVGKPFHLIIVRSHGVTAMYCPIANDERVSHFDDTFVSIRFVRGYCTRNGSAEILL